MADLDKCITEGNVHVNGECENLALRTVRTDITHLRGSKISFEISSKSNPQRHYKVQGAFTASGLDLMEQYRCYEDDKFTYAGSHCCHSSTRAR